MGFDIGSNANNISVENAVKKLFNDIENQYDSKVGLS
jgi:uncharacterized protein YajQ (UPF0234 family)